MTDRPILMSAPMIRALLAETKTQTRRGLKIRGHREFSELGSSDTQGYNWHFRDAEKRWHDLRDNELKARLPWQAGDRLWVREAWQTEARYDGLKPSEIPQTAIRSFEADFTEEPNDGCRGRYRHARFMPRWASRITLTITEVRVQRLQDISEADAMAEGIVEYSDGWHWEPNREGGARLRGDDPIKAYAGLWEEINGPGAWDANPWVVTLTFSVAHRNIDAPL